MAPHLSVFTKMSKKNLDFGSLKSKVEQLPLFCMSFALLISYIKIQFQSFLYLDFEYRSVSKKMGDIFVDCFGDILKNSKKLAGSAVFWQLWKIGSSDNFFVVF